MGSRRNRKKNLTDKPIGPLCREAIDAAENRNFQLFLQDFFPLDMPKLTPHYAAKKIKEYCAIETRKAIDHEEHAEWFWKKLKGNFETWAKEKRAAGV